MLVLYNHKDFEMKIATGILSITTVALSYISYNQYQEINTLSNQLGVYHNEQATLNDTINTLTEQQPALTQERDAQTLKIARLTQENETLKQLLANAQKQTTHETALAKPSAQENNQQEEKDNSLNQVLAQMEAAKKEGKSFDFVAQTQQNFEQEEVDYEWAAQSEQKLTNLFATASELSGATLIATECKASVCKLTVKPNQQMPLTIGMQLNKLVIDKNWHEKSNLVWQNSVSENGEMQLFYNKL